MPRPCSCDSTAIGSPWVSGRDCVKCWLWHNNPASRAAWERGEYPTPVTPPPSDSQTVLVPPEMKVRCHHRGERLAGEPCGSPLVKCGHFGDVASVTKPCSGAARCCVGCPEHPVNKPAAAHPSKVFELGCGGIGDAVQALGVVAKYKADHPEEEVVYRPSALGGSFVKMFHGYDRLAVHRKTHNETDVGDGSVQVNVGYGDEMRSKIAVPRWERYAKNAGASGYLIPPLREPAKVKAAGADLAGLVLLCPYSTDVKREWSQQHFRTLAHKLHRHGYKTAIVAPKGRVVAFFPPEAVLLQDVTPERLAGAMLNAACVVGNDSGPCHLAGALGVPTVVLGGITRVASIFGCYPSVTCLQGTLQCSGCFDGPENDARCETSCSDLQGITPERVFDAIDKIWLEGTLCKDHSLVDAKRLAAIRDAVLATNHLPGDVGEAGCYLGGVSKLIGHYAPKATLRVFDTFEGLPEDDEDKAGHHKKGDFPSNLEKVKAYLDNPRAVFYVGRFPDSAPQIGGQYRVLHIDMDSYQATRDAVAYFGPRMVPGGRMVFDDFFWWACPGVARALYESFPPERIIQTPGSYQCTVVF